MLSLLFHGVIDILIICETKIDDSFPREQFFIEGYFTIYRLDRNDRGGWIMLIVKDNFLTSLLDNYAFLTKLKYFCIALNLRKKKLQIFGCYNPHKHLLKHHLFQIESVINFYSNIHENLIILGDFNAEISDLNMESFCTINNLQCIIKEPKWYKNPDNPTCTDLILRNCPENFQESSSFETGLSDFHKMILTG